jgi:O-antigen/teichoic acid export membrane protein
MSTAADFTIADNFVGRGLRILMLEGGGRKHEEGSARVPFDVAEAARLAGVAITVIIALLGDDLRAVAVSGLFTSLVFVGVFSLWLRSAAPWLRLGWSQATRSEVKRLFHPSISFMSQTLGQAITISGPIIVLGMVANPLDVATFSTCRTLARLGKTATNTINSAMMPEYSRLFGLGNCLPH